jgi:hypothetical protein
MRQNILITGGFRYDFTRSSQTTPVVISRDKKATIGALKRVTVLKGFSKLASNFIDESKDFDFVFSTTRHQKNLKPSATIQKVTICYFRSSKKFIHFMTQSQMHGRSEQESIMLIIFLLLSKIREKM